MTEVRILFVFLQQKREDLAEMTQISGIQKAFIQLHLSVMLAGFTGLFGKLITLNEVDIVLTVHPYRPVAYKERKSAELQKHLAPSPLS